MYCKNCGRNVAPNTNFCPQCGTRLNSYSNSRNGYEHSDNNEQFYKQTWFGILMLFVFWPAGLYLLIKYGGSVTRFVFSIIAGFIAFVFFGMLFLGCSLSAIMLDDMPVDDGLQPRVEQRQDEGSFSDKVLDEMRKGAVSL